MSSIKHAAIYGKRGIGKSCTASNIAAACAEAGHRVLIVGCDPKSDSSITLVGRRIPTMMDLILAGGDIEEKEVVFQGYKGVRCIEVGWPEPGVGCAGRGIIVAIDFLHKVSQAMDDVDLVLYDVRVTSSAADLPHLSEKVWSARHISSPLGSTCRSMLLTTSAKACGA